jgi:alpha-ketoglutarate-dependent taurine dioxygenase
VPGPLPTFSLAEITLTQLQETLSQSKACIIKGFPIGDADYLQSRVQEWGVPLLEPRNLEGGMIYEVCVDATSHLPAYANTSYAFGFHTDCSEFESPPDTVLLLCEQAAPSGGESVAVDLDRAIPHLSFETLLQLQKPQFFFKPMLHSILSLNTQQAIEVRYQPTHFVLGEHLKLWQKTPAQQQALANFETALAQEAVSFLLQPGEALLLNNRRCLHGRQAFQGQRLLKRVRFNLQP